MKKSRFILFCFILFCFLPEFRMCDDPSSQALGVPVPCGLCFAGAEWRVVSCMSYTWASVLCLQRLS